MGVKDAIHPIDFITEIVKQEKPALQEHFYAQIKHEKNRGKHKKRTARYSPCNRI
jgi:hypothetical protein